MKEKVGIGFIGTGFARKVQMPAFAMCERAEIVSVASANLSNAEAAAKEFGASHFTDNWRETVEHEKVDLVCISTPPNLHCEQALYAIEHGKHILCEKPMAMNVEEAEKMCRAAEGKGLLTLIDHELRFQNGRLKARKMLEAGEIGDIRHVKYTFRNPMRGDANVPWNWWSNAQAGGGTLGALGSHAIDSMLWFLQTDISAVFCQLQTQVKNRRTFGGEMREVTTDDETLMILRFADGPLTKDTTGLASLSMVEYPDYEHSIEFVGTSGSLKVLFLGEILLARAGETNWTKVDAEIGPGVPNLFDSGFPSAFVALAPKIVEAVLNGQTTIENAAAFEDGLRVQQIIDAAHESNRAGRQIIL